jgi:hypothetical protein
VATKAKPTEPPNPEKWARLTSFVEGTYDELDKLSKKDSTQGVSSLAKQRVNRAIRDARDLMAGHDDYIADLVEFDAKTALLVRDAVLVLREIKQGLDRIDDRFDLHAVARG